MKSKYVFSAVVVALAVIAIAISHRPGRPAPIQQEASSTQPAAFAAPVALEVKAAPQTEEEALVTYFGLLHDGRYQEATAYQNSYEAVRNWNPDTDSEDFAALLEGGCRYNGWNCLLVREILRSEPIPGGKRLFVTFRNEDGTQFSHGPCCGATEGPTYSEFSYEVVRHDGGFTVMGDPVYTP